MVGRLSGESSSYNTPATTSLTFYGATRQDVNRKRARPESETCLVKRKWTEEQINNPPSKWTGKYTAIKAECKEHQISQSGDLKTCLNRLRTHYKEPHQTATRRARTLTMTDFWKPKGTPS